MGIFKNLFSHLTFAQPSPKKAPFQEIGASGTDIQSGLIQEDFNTDWLFDSSVQNCEEMRKTDAQVQASLQAIKLPLLTANWVIDLDEEGDEEHKEFIKKALFNGMDESFEEFLEEVLAYLDFGFYYFEKVFKIDAEGRIIWKKFAPRIPSAHLYWKTDEGKGSGPKKNEGITQQLKSQQLDQRGQPITNMNPQIPLTKLLVFSHRKEGDNFEGVSILRSAYKHWKLKDIAYKVQMVSIERHGVGLPVITMPKNFSTADRNKAEEALKNLKSNEKSYLILKEGYEFDIKTVAGGKDSQIKDAIDHHNRMITMNILAPFLDLGSSSSGSFALGETQMSFFLNSLQNIAKYVSSILNKAIEELIIINFGEQEHYPKLEATEIGSIDKQVLMNALSAGINSGAIIVDEKLRDWTRENMNLPQEDKEQIEEAQIQKKEEEAAQKKEIPDKKEQEPEDKEKQTKEKFSSKKKLSFTDYKPSERERLFQSSINENERFLEDIWKSKYLSDIRDFEKDMREFLKESYAKAKTEKVNGVSVITSKGNKSLMKRMESGIDARFNKLGRKFESKMYIGPLMKGSSAFASMALSKMSRVQKFFDVFVAEETINAFTAGHLSNVRGFIFNDGRRTKERLLDNFTQNSSIRLVIQQSGKLKLNRNITKLSIITHPRALFKNIIYENAAKDGVIHYKPLIPSQKRDELSPTGAIAAVLFGLFTMQQLNTKGDDKNNANVVGGMGLHHGDFSYMYPVDEDYIEEEERIAREQRKRFLEQINK